MDGIHVGAFLLAIFLYQSNLLLFCAGRSCFPIPPVADVFLIDHNSISGTADVICQSSDVRPTYFISDCYPGQNGQKPEIECRCCSTCCVDTDPTCNTKVWTQEFDPIWENSSVRSSYTYTLNNAPATYATTGSTTGGGSSSNSNNAI